jgi:hypothetical protein
VHASAHVFDYGPAPDAGYPDVPLAPATASLVIVP